MLEAEIALLEAVHTQIITKLPLRAEQCDIEPEEDLAPAIAPDIYLAIVPNGVFPGPRQNTSGGVWDLTFSVRIVAYEKIADVARDRQKNVYLNRVKNLNGLLSRAIRFLVFNQDVRTRAENLLSGLAEGGQFPEPFKTFTPDKAARSVSWDVYDGAQPSGGNPIVSPILAMKRGVTLDGCRFLRDRTIEIEPTATPPTGTAYPYTVIDDVGDTIIDDAGDTLIAM